MNISKNIPNCNRIRVFFIQNWCRSDKSAYDWPISSISSISCDTICTRHILFYISKHSERQPWCLIDSKCAQRPLNCIFSAFSGWDRKATRDGQFRYFRRLVIPLKSRLRYPGLLYKKEEWSYLDFWQLTSQTYLQHCLLLRALLHINFFRKIRKSKGMFFSGGPCMWVRRAHAVCQN